MGPKGTSHQLSESNLTKLAIAVTATGRGFSGIPAGFTYLGQFIDHDLIGRDGRNLRSERVAGQAPPGPLPQPRP